MLMIKNSKTLNRLWSAINGDFECLMTTFLEQPGSTFADFAKCCRQLEITLILHITQGKGKFKQAHYTKILTMIFEAAKSCWLRRTPANELDLEGDVNDSILTRKRQLGGFYLTYLMFIKQPLEGKVCIVLDIENLKAVNVWRHNLKDSPVKNEVTFILRVLKLRNAIQYQICADEFRIEPEVQNCNTMSQHTMVELNRQARDLQDQLAFSSVVTKGQEKVLKYCQLKLRLAKVLQHEDMTTTHPVSCINTVNSTSIPVKETENLVPLSAIKSENTDFMPLLAIENSDEVQPIKTENQVLIPTLKTECQVETSELVTENSSSTSQGVNIKKTIGEISPGMLECLVKAPGGSEELTKAVRKWEELVDKPILTYGTMLGINSNVISGYMRMETRKRIARVAKKIEAANLPAEQRLPARPYINEGGVFGRKKEPPEIGDEIVKRERGLCSGNLWTYIYGLSFGDTGEEDKKSKKRKKKKKIVDSDTE